MLIEVGEFLGVNKGLKIVEIKLSDRNEPLKSLLGWVKKLLELKNIITQN